MSIILVGKIYILLYKLSCQLVVWGFFCQCYYKDIIEFLVDSSDCCKNSAVFTVLYCFLYSLLSCLWFLPQGYYKDTVEFFFDSRDCCKNFWKKCLEHHAFFRCHRIKPVPRNKTRLVSHGSSFRYNRRSHFTAHTVSLKN